METDRARHRQDLQAQRPHAHPEIVILEVDEEGFVERLLLRQAIAVDQKAQVMTDWVLRTLWSVPAAGASGFSSVITPRKWLPAPSYWIVSGLWA